MELKRYQEAAVLDGALTALIREEIATRCRARSQIDHRHCCPLFLMSVFGARALSELLQDLFDKHSAPAELGSLNHEEVECLFSVQAYIGDSRKIDHQPIANGVILRILAGSLD